MSRIKIERPTEKMLKELGIDKWSPWECEPSTFDWEYPADETAYVFEGRVKVKTKALSSTCGKYGQTDDD